MAGWVDDFLDYAKTAVSRVTSVTALNPLIAPGNQVIERAVTGACAVELDGSNSAKDGIQVTIPKGAALPAKPIEFIAVTKVTVETDEGCRYEQRYLIDERAAFVQRCVSRARDEAMDSHGD